MAIPILFGSINVNSLNNNAIIAVGENVQANWSSHSKRNFGNGMLFGLFLTCGMINIVIDCDVVDTPIFDPDFSSAGQNQQL